jgi:hypothetical protein
MRLVGRSLGSGVYPAGLRCFDVIDRDPGHLQAISDIGCRDRCNLNEHTDYDARPDRLDDEGCRHLR